MRAVAILREWLQRLRGLAHRDRSDADLARELAFHVEQTEHDLRQRGYSAREAYRLARVRAGSADRAIEELRTQAGVPWFGTFTIDVRLGWRMLRKYWGLSLVGGLAIAVVIGICAAVFLFFDVMWSTDLPLDEGERVVAIQVWDASAGRRRETALEDFRRWRVGLATLEDFGGFRTVERSLSANGAEAARISVAEMSAAGFRLTRMAPLLGRPLVADDERPGAEPVVVIGYDEWRRRFGADRNVLGSAVRLDDTFYTIVGVMPADFGFPVNYRFWTALGANAEGRLSAPPYGGTFGRLAPGHTLADVQAELTALGVSNDVERDDTEELRLVALPYAQNFVDDIDPDEYGQRSSTARLVLLLMSLLLVPPGVNIAILVYARTVTRQEEIAVRTALGATRRRIVAQLFVEMLVLSCIAATIALAGVRVLAHYVEGFMVRQLATLPFWIDFRITPRTFVFVAFLAVAAAVLTGFVPALRATRLFGRPGAGRLAGQRARLGGFWTALIVAQIAFSFALLPIVTQVAWGILRPDVLGPGFPAEEYVSAQLALDTDSPVVDTRDPARQRVQFAAAQEQLFRALRAEPGVIAGPSLMSAPPGAGPWVRVETEQHPSTPADVETLAVPPNPIARRMLIDAAFLETFAAKPVVGREFAAGEFQAASRVVIVSERFVERTLAGRNPLGLRMRYASLGGTAAGAAGDAPWYEIVGVVPDVPDHAYRGTIYEPLTTASMASASIAIRVAAGTPAFGNRLRELAAATSPPLRLSEVRSLAEVYEGQAIGNYVGGFALVAGTLSVLLLAAAGTYALMAFTVNERRREIGIRVALGAPRARLLSAVLRRALRQVLVGALVGAAFALFMQVTIPVESVGGSEIPGVLPAAAALMVLLGLIATLGPARRVIKIDPNAALRDGG